MREEQREQAVRRVVWIAELARGKRFEPATTQRRISMSTASFSFGDEAELEYETLVASLLGHDDWADEFSENYMRGVVNALPEVCRPDIDQAVIRRHLDDAVAKLEGYDVTHRAVVPFPGIVMGSQPLDLGLVRLKLMTSQEVDALVDEMKSSILLTTSRQEDKDFVISRMRQQARGYFKGGVCAEFEAVAEPERLRERAEDEARRVIDLLRYAIPAVYPVSVAVFVGLFAEILQGVRPAFIVSPTAHTGAWDIRRVGAQVPFAIDSRSMQILETIGVFKLSDLLKKPDPTDSEQVLLRAIHWLAVAQVQVEAESELLNLITCLETFLTPRDGNPIGTAIAEGVAFLISNDLETRKKLKRRVQDLYRKRSAVSHGGKKAILDADLSELRSIARSLVETMIDRLGDFQSQRALLDLIEDQKLG